jgi:hypothetical protein
MKNYFRLDSVLLVPVEEVPEEVSDSVASVTHSKFSK